MADAVKRCPKCDTEKALAAFHRDRSRKSGLAVWCKECLNAAGRVQRENTDPEKKRAWARRNYHRNRERFQERDQKRQQEHPEQHRAHVRVAYALATGKLVRPETCPRCASDKYQVQAHHADYSKPLEVEWLCARCHKLMHQEEAVV